MTERQWLLHLHAKRIEARLAVHPYPPPGRFLKKLTRYHEYLCSRITRPATIGPWSWFPVETLLNPTRLA